MCKAVLAAFVALFVVALSNGAPTRAHGGDPPPEMVDGHAITAAAARPDGWIVGADRSLWHVGDGAPRRLARLESDATSIDAKRGLVAVVAPEHDRAVLVYSVSRGELRALGGGVEPRRRPSRVSLGDLDGDGRIEALVLVTGHTRFDPREALRPFVYGWDGRRLYPKWLGSRLSRPFDDACLGDLDGDGRDELVAVEQTREGSRELAAYVWRGFGFERIATSEPLAGLCGVNVDAEGHVRARTADATRVYALASGALRPPP